jgi:putative ABC transport system substrate-binding protein
MKKNRLSLIIIAIISIFSLIACGTEKETTEDTGDSKEGTKQETKGEEKESFTIGATQIVEHPSLDAAYEGFKDAIADAGLNVEYDLQNAQNDQNNASIIAKNFVADNVDLIFANSTPSAQSALQATKDIPIIFTSVTDAVEAGLVTAMDKPGENITGVLDLHPDAIKNTVNFIDTYFEDSKVGLIYNAGEQNSVTQIEAVKAAAKGTSLSLEERTVSTSAEVQQAATTLVGEADVIYIITDNTVVSALESVVGVANEHDLPLIVGEPNSLAKGGFATYGIDYHTIGYRAGEMAVKVLTGEKSTSEIPVEYPEKMQLFINKKAATEQGIEWNNKWDEIAQFIETE